MVRYVIEKNLVRLTGTGKIYQEAAGNAFCQKKPLSA